MPKFTAAEKRHLKSLVQDCDLYGLSERQALDYIASRFGREISSPYYYILKRKVQSDVEAQKWLSHFSRVGFVLAHKQRMDEMDLCMRILLQMLFEKRAKMLKKQQRAELEGWQEEDGGDDDVATILSVMDRIGKVNKRLSNLSAGSPIVSQISAMLQGQDPTTAVMPHHNIKEEGHRSNNNGSLMTWLQELTSTIHDPQQRREIMEALLKAKEEEVLAKARSGQKQQLQDDEQNGI